MAGMTLSCCEVVVRGDQAVDLGEVLVDRPRGAASRW